MSLLVETVKIVVGSGTLAIKLWDSGDGVCLQTFRPLPDGTPNPLQFNISIGDVLVAVNGADVSGLSKEGVISTLSHAAQTGKLCLRCFQLYNLSRCYITQVETESWFSRRCPQIRECRLQAQPHIVRRHQQLGL